MLILKGLGQTLKGIETPVQAYRVLGTSGAQSRLDVVSPRGLTPLVGREAEMAVLRERWAQARDGLGQVVLLSGEAGIGKSRLVQVLQEHVAAEPYTRLEWRCSPYHSRVLCIPSSHICTVCCAGARTMLRRRNCDTGGGAGRVRLGAARDVPLFATLLSLPLPERYPPLTLPPSGSSRRPWTPWWPGCWPRQRDSRCCSLSKTCTGSIPRRWSCSPSSSIRDQQPVYLLY